MANRRYRSIAHPGDPRTGFVIPRELYDALVQSAESNHRKLSQEIITRLAMTLEDPELMSRDRLMRLIFCSELAYENKNNKRTFNNQGERK